MASSEYKKKKSHLPNENIVRSSGWHPRRRALSLAEPARFEQRVASSISDALQVCPSDGRRPITSHNGHEEGRQRYKERHEAKSSVTSN